MLCTHAGISHSTPASALISSNPPSPHPISPPTPERLEIAPPVHSRIFEVKDAVQVINHEDPYLDSLESDDEFDNSTLMFSTKTASRAAIYLHSYLRGAKLPQLYRGLASGYADVLFPLEDLPKRNLLAVSPNQKRMISQIRRFSRDILCKATKLYLLESVYKPEDFVTIINTGIPAPSPDEALTLESYVGNSFLDPEEKVPTYYPKNLPQLIEWIDRYPLRTLTRAIHLANPSTAGWWFERIYPQDLGEDFVKNRQMLAVLGWRFHPTQPNRPWFKEVDDEIGWIASKETGLDLLKAHPHQQPWFIPAPEVSMAIIIQPPWVLSWEDLQNVAKCKDLPRLTGLALDPSKHYTMAQRVWCQIRDACHKLNTKYFLLTTYEGWLFGKFGGGIGGSGYIPNSQPCYVDPNSYDCYDQRVRIAPWAFDQWTYVETSELLEYKASNPNLMQVFHFWVARSMGLKKSRKVALELQLTDHEIAMVERLTTSCIPKQPSRRVLHYEPHESQHHTGNRPRPTHTSRFAPYSARPSRQPCKGSDGASSTGLFAFIRNIGKYLSGSDTSQDR